MPRAEVGDYPRKRLARSDDEGAARPKEARDLPGNGHLHVRREVREGEVPAEDKVERTVRTIGIRFGGSRFRAEGRERAAHLELPGERQGVRLLAWRRSRRHAAPHAPFYEGSLEGRKVVVTYSAAHPAYQRLIMDNRDNRGQIAAMDFLVWSLVSAELRKRWRSSPSQGPARAARRRPAVRSLRPGRP